MCKYIIHGEENMMNGKRCSCEQTGFCYLSFSKDPDSSSEESFKFHPASKSAASESHARIHFRTFSDLGFVYTLCSGDCVIYL